MGLKSAKLRVVTALRAGTFEHEAREALAEKNLLAIGAVSAEFVADLVQRTSGADYSESPHHLDGAVIVHVFRPSVQRNRWYVKVYFLEHEGRQAVFISVHRSEAVR